MPSEHDEALRTLPELKIVATTIWKTAQQQLCWETALTELNLAVAQKHLLARLRAGAGCCVLRDVELETPRATHACLLKEQCTRYSNLFWFFSLF